MRRLAVWALAAALAAVGLTGATGAPTTTYTHGYDVSWPQCRDDGSSAMPSRGARFVILGLTHGAGHTVNPCLSAQVDWARSHSVPVGAYLVPSFPTKAQLDDAGAGPYGACGDDRGCRLGNDGARQAADALATLHASGVPAPMLWVDVEFRHVHPWSRSRADNARVVEGVFTGLRSAGMPFGVYTTSYMWSHIVGALHVNVPNWLPTGDTKASHLHAECRDTGTGGVTWLAQDTRTYDEDVTCPVMDAVPGRHGPLYRWRNSVLSIGSAGVAVRLAQAAIGSPAQVTGRFDGRTLAAVVAFQALHRLPVTGRIDNDDWRALGAYRLHGGHGFLLGRVVAPVPSPRS